MRKILLILLIAFTTNAGFTQPERLIYHDIKVDANGKILPWYNDEPGKSYSHIVNLIWNFWDTMRIDINGLPYYLNHQVWRPIKNDPRGIGGDQIQMAMSSWRLLYQYSGNERVKENIRFLADYYLTNGFSPPDAQWANLPFPYNNLVYSGKLDGDMIIGKGFTQPDKAGSLGIELVNLYKMVSREFYPNVTNQLYLDAAMGIANTLAKHMSEGDSLHSPLPFKVNAYTGEIGKLKSNDAERKIIGLSDYTTNWCGAMELFLELKKLNPTDSSKYDKAFYILLNWMKKYPLRNNRWGPFFEDITGWSDTQINAVTFAQFIMNHREFFPNWKSDVRNILDWVYKELGNDKWKKYGVTVVTEQTAYRVPGNSHSSRQASAELQYSMLTGDTKWKENAILQLNWATYMVDNDGKNRYPQDENWLTDGYGDYVRHYLRSMGAAPELAPSDEDHILFSTSVIQQATYTKNNSGTIQVRNKEVDAAKARIFYRVYDSAGSEKIRMSQKPTAILFNDQLASETTNSSSEGFQWQPMANGGVLNIFRKKSTSVTIFE